MPVHYLIRLLAHIIDSTSTMELSLQLCVVVCLGAMVTGRQVFDLTHTLDTDAPQYPLHNLYSNLPPFSFFKSTKLIKGYFYGDVWWVDIFVVSWLIVQYKIYTCISLKLRAFYIYCFPLCLYKRTYASVSISGLKRVQWSSMSIWGPTLMHQVILVVVGKLCMRFPLRGSLVRELS